MQFSRHCFGVQSHFPLPVGLGLGLGLQQLDQVGPAFLSVQSDETWNSGRT